MDRNIISMIFHFDLVVEREGLRGKTILMMFTQFVCACQHPMYLRVSEYLSSGVPAFPSHYMVLYGD